MLVAVDLCGICGSDLHASLLPQVYRVDCVLGQESTGRGAAVGDDVADWAVELAGDLTGRTVLVTGGGPIGQLACRLAHLQSPAQILLMEPAAQRAQFAAESHAVPPAADAAPDGPAVDVVLECSGSAAATVTALKLLVPGGILVVVGVGPESGFDSTTILLKKIRVRGPISTPTNSTARSLLATRQVLVADLTTVISPLPDALSAFDALRAGEIMKAPIASGTGPGMR